MSYTFYKKGVDKQKKINIIRLMLINKITTGFVIQVFDTDTKKYVSQNFVAGDQVDYESTDGQTPIEDGDLEKYNFGPDAENEPYLPFDMLQPKEEK